MNSYDQINSVMSKRIKEAREKKRMTVRELADKTGFGVSAISRYENGKVDKMPCDRLAMIALVLNVSPVWLMGFDVEEPKESEYTLDDSERFMIDTYREADGRQKARISKVCYEIADEIEKNGHGTDGNRAIG